MKKLFLFFSIIIGVLTINIAVAQILPRVKYIDALHLNLIGKIAPTTEPYHRVDTIKYKGFTPYQNTLVHESSGLMLSFKTNTSQLKIKTYCKWIAKNTNMTGTTMYGYDLYIKKNGKWLFAAANATNKGNGAELNLISHMDNTEKECLLYLPLFSVVDSIRLGIDSDATITAVPNPFRHRIVVFGSSFTHGTCTNRPGMSYPKILERNTGLYIMNLGVSGNSMLQQSFAHVLADADADAFIFDAFSNPNAQMIEERFDSFVKTIRDSHPTAPLIFMQTIYREQRNFDKKCDSIEQEKMCMAEKVVKRAMLKDKNIYFLNPQNMTGNDHLTSTDGIHPSDFGYYRWAVTIQPLILNILKRYNIK